MQIKEEHSLIRFIYSLLLPILNTLYYNIYNPTQKPPSSFHFLINSLLKYTVLNVIIIVGY